ncbi:AraC family transcriptional regulator [Algibacter mikhailovii]|uniref:AraC family transcriptional regulator n=1 Tax=Algibacter mikhailovii TaxID=425498 RepID=A0A918R6Z9_9FLAO|nr:AraC family transcriptional regulator [Algibacter mikhailovii]GGZ87562.1 AraC family transcriptional regulator [Algibacter mikhailovii]
MELKYSPLKSLDSQSFYVKRHQVPYFGPDWHYHDEYELILTLKGEGVRIIGDEMDQFEAPELILIGSNLPHLFKNKVDETEVDYIVLKFKDDINELPLFKLPELNRVKDLLRRSKRGIKFSPETVQKIKPLFIKLAENKGCNKVISFLQIFDILSNASQTEYLASEKFSLQLIEDGEDRLQKVLNYLGEEYTRDISLEELAEIAHMTKNAFCRYFKEKTGKTAFGYLREYRVSKACQMLISSNKTITEICYDTGFNSFSSFTRIFKSLKNISASEYQNRYLRIGA